MTDDYLRAARELNRLLNSPQVRQFQRDDAEVGAWDADIEQLRTQAQEAARSPQLRIFMESYTRLQQQLAEVRRTNAQSQDFPQPIDASTVRRAVEAALVAEQGATGAGQSAWSSSLQKVFAALQPPLDARFTPWQAAANLHLGSSASWEARGTATAPVSVPIETLDDLQQLAEAAEVSEDQIQALEDEISDIGLLNQFLDDAADQVVADNPSITRVQARRLIMACAYAAWVLGILGLTVFSEPVFAAVAAVLGADAGRDEDGPL